MPCAHLLGQEGLTRLQTLATAADGVHAQHRLKSGDRVLFSEIAGFANLPGASVCYVYLSVSN